MACDAAWAVGGGGLVSRRHHFGNIQINQIIFILIPIRGSRKAKRTGEARVEDLEIGGDDGWSEVLSLLCYISVDQPK